MDTCTLLMRDDSYCTARVLRELSYMLSLCDAPSPKNRDQPQSHPVPSKNYYPRAFNPNNYFNALKLGLIFLKFCVVAWICTCQCGIHQLK